MKNLSLHRRAAITFPPRLFRPFPSCIVGRVERVHSKDKKRRIIITLKDSTAHAHLHIYAAIFFALHPPIMVSRVLGWLIR